MQISFKLVLSFSLVSFSFFFKFYFSLFLVISFKF